MFASAHTHTCTCITGVPNQEPRGIPQIGGISDIHRDSWDRSLSQSHCWSIDLPTHLAELLPDFFIGRFYSVNFYRSISTLFVLCSCAKKGKAQVITQRIGLCMLYSVYICKCLYAYCCCDVGGEPGRCSHRHARRRHASLYRRRPTHTYTLLSNSRRESFHFLPSLLCVLRCRCIRT